jgi:hypothetical protein
MAYYQREYFNIFLNELGRGDSYKENRAKTQTPKAMREHSRGMFKI